MPSSYPSGLDALQRVAAGDSMQSTSHSGLHNSQSDAIEAIQTVLGLSPQGGSATVGARCAALESGKASLNSSPVFTGTVEASGLAGSLLSSASPVMNGVAAAGTGVVPSRQDHVHPTDTSRAAASHAARHAADGSDPLTLAQSQVTGLPADLTARVTGPASSTDNTLPRFDLATGKVLQGSGVTVDDSNNISGLGTIGSGAITSSGAVEAAAASGFVVGPSGPKILSGNGSPEGVVSAPVGSVWKQTDAAGGLAWWEKGVGSGNTGWALAGGALPVAVGQRFDLSPYSGVPTTGAPATVGHLYIVPVNVPCYMTINRLDLRVATAAAAGASWRLGFWKLDGTGGTPSTLITDLGTIDPTTTGIKSLTGLSTVLPAGRVAFGYALQGTGSGGGTCFGGPPLPIVDTGSGTRLSASMSGWLQTGVTGALGAATTAAPTGLAYVTPNLVVERSA